MKVVSIITSSQPSTNPRAVKEAIALSNNNYTVYFIYAVTTPWAQSLDEYIILQNSKIHWIKAAGLYSTQKISYYYYRFRRKFYEQCYRVSKIQKFLNKSLILYGQELLKEGKKYKADLLIGHNLGVLPILVELSKFHTVASIFDFEDYHRGEFMPDTTQAKERENIENIYVPEITTLITSSPEIANTYNEHFNYKKFNVLHNVFPYHYAVDNISDLPQKPLKLFWFSQCVGKGRGLELVLKVIGKLQPQCVELTLLGSITYEIKVYFLNLLKIYNIDMKYLRFIEPRSELEIIKIASNHHIGLACEISELENRDLCLTNKIFMYLLAGNALLVSNTKAQSNFISRHLDIGILFDQNNEKDLENAIKYYIEHPDELSRHRFNALSLAKSELNWDFEQKKLIKLIDQTIVQ